MVRFCYRQLSKANKGVYHINAVDQVTQFESVVWVSKISETHLIPALQQLLDSFPFEIRGFHSDNGSEFADHIVARLLVKLRRTISLTSYA